MHANKKIIICKFRHLNKNELNDIWTKFKGLKQDYESLKRNFRENCENF